MSDKYKIVRFFQDTSLSARVLKRGLTLEEAQRHCIDPQTSSETCTSPEAQAVAEECGPWFDGYEKEPDMRVPDGRHRDSSYVI